MKKIFFLLLLALGALYFSKDSLLKYLVQKNIQASINDSTVSLEGARLGFPGSIYLKGLKTGSGGRLSLKVDEVKILFKPSVIFTKKIDRIIVLKPVLSINSPDLRLMALPGSLLAIKKGSRGFIYDNVEIGGADISISSSDVSFKMMLSGIFLPAKGTVEALNLDMPSYKQGDISISGLKLSYPRNSREGEGNVSVEKISFNKIAALEINSSFGIKGNSLSFGNLAGKLWEGSFSGRAGLEFGKNISYSASITAKDMDLDDIINSLDLAGKVDMSGRLEGGFSLKGVNVMINDLEGDLSVSSPGGDMTIKDRKMLQDIAKRAKQDENLIVETFQKYHYNKGSIKVFMENNNIVTKVSLEGEAGKRDLEVVLHNFS